MDIKSYATPQITEYKGTRYVFNPFFEGVGAWATLNKNNTVGTYVSIELEKELNIHYYGVDQLPPMIERILGATYEEKEILKKISIDWLSTKIRTLNSERKQRKYKTTISSPNSSDFKSGGMYFYFYESFWKQEVPYWDRFPLIILLETKNSKNGMAFLGLNLHYIDPTSRALFLAKLFGGRSNFNRDTNMVNLTINYDQIKSMSNLKEYKACIKSYLVKNVKSKILAVEAHEWLYAAMLQVESFQKKPKETVWKESQKKIDNG